MTSVSARFTNDFYLELDLMVADAYQLDRRRGVCKHSTAAQHHDARYTHEALQIA